VQLTSPGPNWGARTALPHVERKAFGRQWVVGQPSHLLPFHFPAGPTPHPPNGDLQVETRVATGQVPNPAELVVVKRAMPTATGPTACFSPDAGAGECGPSDPQTPPEPWPGAETPRSDTYPQVVGVCAYVTSANYFQGEKLLHPLPRVHDRQSARLFYPLNSTKTQIFVSRFWWG